MRVLALALALLLAAMDPALSAQNASGVRGPRRTGSIAGRIIQADGAAAQGARVAVYAVREDAAAGVVGTTTSRYDGRYEVTGLPPGRFMIGVTPVKVTGFGGDSKRPPAVPVETMYPGVSERDRAHPVTVYEGIAAEGIDVWLSPAPQRFSVSGRVSWPEGTAVDGIVIEYGGREAVRGGIWYVDDPGGLFTLEGMAQETYVLLVRAETPSGPLLGIASTDVAVGPVEDIRIVLRPPGGIEGRIVVEGTAKAEFTGLRVVPVQTLLRLSPVYPVEDAAVGGDGRFTLPHLAGAFTLDVRGLPSGWRVRRVSRGGTALVDGVITVPAGETIAGVEIVIGAGST